MTLKSSKFLVSNCARFERPHLQYYIELFFKENEFTTSTGTEISYRGPNNLYLDQLYKINLGWSSKHQESRIVV